jgi:hypothetical protein
MLATVWSLIEGAPLSANRGDEPPFIPDAAIVGVRQTMDRMLGSYLTRRGKKRYCDKSLGTAGVAELLLRVYPQAKFLCLYRHPMDVVVSGMEACPWGLSGYGFDSYIATTPGNAVMALARFWLDNASATLAAEERFPERCLRVRYEDLVTDPEGTASGIFAFLEASPVPGISSTCFSADRERFGPADYKIWYTSEISSASLGRGWSVPAGMIAPQVLAAINELASKLGYMPVDEAWGTSAPPADLRVPITAELEPSTAELAGPAPEPGLQPEGPVSREAYSARNEPETAIEAEACDVLEEPGEPVLSRMLGDALREGMERAVLLPDRWRDHEGENFVAVWVPTDPRQPAEHWQIDLTKKAVTFVTRAAQENSDWDVVGSAEAWNQVIEGRLNISVAFRSCQIRYCDGDEDGGGPLNSEARLDILADLLPITRW